MSRTLAHRPLWVRAREGVDARPFHSLACTRGQMACDLDAVPRTRESARWPHCQWWSHSEWFGSAPADFRATVFERPERARVRDELRLLTKQVNGTVAEDRDDLLDELDVENRQHRHCAAWLWW